MGESGVYSFDWVTESMKGVAGRNDFVKLLAVAAEMSHMREVEEFDESLMEWKRFFF